MNDTRSHGYMSLIKLCLVLLFLGGCIYYINKGASSTVAYTSTSSNNNPSLNSDVVVNVDNPTAVSNFLASRTFKNSKDNLTVKFYPEGYYELKKDYEVALTGKWSVGEKKYDSSVMIYLMSDGGDLSMMLSSDGKIMDKASLRIFE